MSGADLDADLERMDRRIDELGDEIGEVDGGLGDLTQTVSEMLSMLRMAVPLPQRDRFDELIWKLTPHPTTDEVLDAMTREEPT